MSISSVAYSSQILMQLKHWSYFCKTFATGHMILPFSEERRLWTRYICKSTLAVLGDVFVCNDCWNLQSTCPVPLATLCVHTAKWKISCQVLGSCFAIWLHSCCLSSRDIFHFSSFSFLYLLSSVFTLPYYFVLDLLVLDVEFHPASVLPFLLFLFVISFTFSVYLLALQCI